MSTRWCVAGAMGSLRGDEVWRHLRCKKSCVRQSTLVTPTLRPWHVHLDASLVPEDCCWQGRAPHLSSTRPRRAANGFAILSQVATNFKGVMIGNPEMDTLLQYPAEAYYLRGLGLLGDLELEQALKDFGYCQDLVETRDFANAFTACEAWVDSACAACGDRVV
jgi:hypothetical protein